MLLPNFLSSADPKICAVLSTIIIVFLAAVLGVLQHFPGGAPPPADPLTASFFSLAYDVPLPPLPLPLDVDNRARIFGGVPTPPHRYPYAVLLFLQGNQCGGSLIADNLVLTAAHCGPDTFLESHVGIYSWSESITLYESVSIEEAIVHPDYAGAKDDYEHDFMILVLAKKVKKFRPVCLAEADVDIFPEKKLAVMGWGLMEGGKPSEMLMEADVSYISNAQCRSATLDDVYVFAHLVDSENYLCAASLDGKDACQGDSGGPLVMKGDDNNPDKDVQVGVVSFGYACGTVGIYGRISTQRNWIDSVARNRKSIMRQDCNGHQKKGPKKTPPKKPKGRSWTVSPTEELTNYPSLLPVVATAVAPTPAPTSKPSPIPTSRPSRPAAVSTKEPTYYPTLQPVVATTMAHIPAPLHFQISSDPSNGSAKPTLSPTSVPTGVLTIVPTHCQPIDVGIMIEGDLVDCLYLAERSQLNCTMARDAAACPVACSCARARCVPTDDPEYTHGGKVSYCEAIAQLAPIRFCKDVGVRASCPKTCACQNKLSG